MISIQVNALYLKSLRHIMAVRDVRYYLNGVLVQCDVRGKFYVACDGHRLAVYFEKWGDGEEVQDCAVIIPGDVVKAIKPEKHGVAAVLSGAEKYQDEHGRTVVKSLDWKLDTFNGPALSFKAIDGKFVDWQRVIPEKVSGDVCGVNFDYLADFNACLRDGTGAKFSAVVRYNGEGAAVVMPANDVPFLGVVMTMRGRTDDYARPEWLSMPREELKQAA